MMAGIATETPAAVAMSAYGGRPVDSDMYSDDSEIRSRAVSRYCCREWGNSDFTLVKAPKDAPPTVPEATFAVMVP